MKKKTLFTAILSLVVCLSLIAGSTFALFTSESETNIAVTSGKVKVEASFGAPVLYSPSAIAPDGTISDATNAADTTFRNGGTATVVGSALKLERVTPGDKVTVPIALANTSNVDTVYRLVIQPIDTTPDAILLYSGLRFIIDESKDFTGVSYYASAWTPLEAGVDIPDLKVEVELPATAGNEYQDLATTIHFAIEAVQANAAPAGEEVMEWFAKDSKPVDKVDGVIQDASLQQIIDSYDGTMVVPDEGSQVTVNIPAEAIDEGAAEVSVLVFPTTNPANLIFGADDVAESFEVTVCGIKPGNTEPVDVTIQLKPMLKNVTLHHSGVAMNQKLSVDEVMADQDYYYDSATGLLSFKTTTFSPVTCMYSYVTCEVSDEAELKDAFAEHADVVILVADFAFAEEYSVQTDTVMDLNGHTLTTTAGDITINNAKLTLRDTVGTGGVEKTTTESGQTALIWMDGDHPQLIMEGGNLYGNGSSCVYVVPYTTSTKTYTIEIHGGSMKTTANDSSDHTIDASGIPGTFTMTGGHIEMDAQVSHRAALKIGISYGEEMCDCNISGGEIVTNSTGDRVYGIWGRGNVNLNISGDAKISASGGSWIWGIYAENNTQVTLSGNASITIAAESRACCIMGDSEASLTVSDNVSLTYTSNSSIASWDSVWSDFDDEDVTINGYREITGYTPA